MDCGEDYHKGHLPPLPWSTRKILLILDKLKMDLPTPNQSRDIEVHTLFLTLNTMKVAQLIRSSSIKLQIIDSQKTELSKK